MRLPMTGSRSVEVKEHRIEADEVRLALWQPMPEPVAERDLFVVTAGCDKRFETCRTKFANAVNFRGFPHLPGNDFVAPMPCRASRDMTEARCANRVFP
jgi:uncharacterized phage protein (TIGR02218 family)